ncbi:hypothetical protein HER39_09375 [Arthrobacter deserti]|uniref:Uncharacterized protein n=1 Tax=Arthrobacter deserti TaxID=1742687 RepID=A0ABX1JR76_9MICC|nr:hypothetical protein [Arthrobacter deserti]
MTQPADMVRSPRRRDIRTGSADPVPPTGMIPIVPLVAAPTGDPLPTRKELRTGLVQPAPQAGAPQADVPPAAASGPDSRRPRQPEGGRPRRWLWALPAAAVAAALAVLWVQIAG